MPTKSIFKNIFIDDQDAAEAFCSALDESHNAANGISAKDRALLLESLKEPLEEMVDADNINW